MVRVSSQDPGAQDCAEHGYAGPSPDTGPGLLRCAAPRDKGMGSCLEASRHLRPADSGNTDAIYACVQKALLV